MAGKPVSPEKEMAILAAFAANPHSAIKEVSRNVGAAAETVRAILLKHGVSYDKTQATPEARAKNVAADTLHQALLDVYRGCSLDVQLRVPKRPTRWVILDDWHIPTCDREVIDAMLRAEPKLDGIITAEVLSADAFSPFGCEHKSDTKVEFVAAGELLAELAEHVSLGVYVTRSNHVERVTKWFKREAKNADQLEVAAAGFKTYAKHLSTTTKVKKVFNSSGFVQFGAVVFAHGDKFMVTQGNSAQAEADKLLSQPQVHGVIEPLDLIIVAHEHRRSETYARGRQCQLWVSPSACYFQRYALGSKPATYNRHPVVCGWSVVQLDANGRLVPHESHTVHYKYAVLPPAVEAWRRGV